MPSGVGAVSRVRLLAGEHGLLVDDREPVVPVVERAAVEPGVDLVGGLATLAHGARDVGGTVHGVAGREHVRDPGLAGGRVGREPAVRRDRDPVAEHRRVGRHADRRDDHVRRRW